MEIGIGLRWVVEACRRNDDSAGDLFACGHTCAEAHLGDFMPAEVRADLEAGGLLTRTDDGAVRLTLRCHNVNNLVSIVPYDQGFDAGFVHVNADTGWLVNLAWQHGEPGDAAVELAAGNAIAAAHLVARYKRVVATDVPGPWLRFAQLTLAANAARGRPSGVVVSDVAAALRPAAFDLVIANPPWSPAAPKDVDGRTITFMDGGPTGTELPARFLREGPSLLRRGGTAITLCFDPWFEDGRRPLLEVLDDIRADGFGVETIDSPIFPTDEVTARLRERRLPTLKQGRHLAVVVHKT